MKTSVAVIAMFLVLCSVSGKLLSAININRHGARTPKNFEKLTSKLYYGSGQSHLIINGLRQQQILGRWINNRYVNEHQILSEEYNPNECSFYASPSSRAIFSAAGYLQGLYKDYILKPIFNTEKSNISQNILPPLADLELQKESLKEIPLEIENSYSDVIFHAIDCKFSKDSKDTIKKEGFEKMIIFEDPDQAEIIKTVEDIKLHMPHLFNGVKPEVYQTWLFLKDLNSFLKQFEPILTKKLGFSESTKRVLRRIDIQKNYGPRIKETRGVRVVTSGFFDVFIETFDKHVNMAGDKKNFILFSGHDTNIFALWSSLLDSDYLLKLCKAANIDQKPYDFLMMTFASSFIIELHSTIIKDIDIFFVKIIFNGEEVTEGFNSAIRYNWIIGGIEYNQFRTFLVSKIDPDYKNLHCNLDNDIDYTVPINYFSSFLK